MDDQYALLYLTDMLLIDVGTFDEMMALVKEPDGEGVELHIAKLVCSATIGAEVKVDWIDQSERDKH